MSSATPGFAGPIVTGEAVAIDLRTAGIGSRGVAVLVDFALQGVLLWGIVYATAATQAGVNDATAAALLVVTTVGLLVGYPVGFETLWRGRTPGKAVMGLRVVRDDGGPIRFRHAFVRGLVGVVLDRLGVSFGLLALAPMLVTARSKRLGDLAAGTIVLQERVPARVGAPPPMPQPLAGWATTLDLSGIGDDLALQVRQFLSRAGELAPWARDDLGRRLLGEVVRRTGAPPPAGVPPWAYLSAVLAERRRRELQRASWGGPSGVAPPAAPPPAAPLGAPPDEPRSTPPPASPRSTPPPAAPPPPPGPFAPPA